MCPSRGRLWRGRSSQPCAPRLDFCESRACSARVPLSRGTCGAVVASSARRAKACSSPVSKVSAADRVARPAAPRPERARPLHAYTALRAARGGRRAGLWRSGATPAGAGAAINRSSVKRHALALGGNAWLAAMSGPRYPSSLQDAFQDSRHSRRDRYQPTERLCNARGAPRIGSRRWREFPTAVLKVARSATRDRGAATSRRAHTHYRSMTMRGSIDALQQTCAPVSKQIDDDEVPDHRASRTTASLDSARFRRGL